jgi:hypothetical protein
VVGVGVEAVVVEGAVVVTEGAGAGARVTVGLGVTGSGVGALAVEDVVVGCEELRRCGFAFGLGVAGLWLFAGTDVVAGASPAVTDNGSPASPTGVAAS